jgi:hypothetical protein
MEWSIMRAWNGPLDTAVLAEDRECPLPNRKHHRLSKRRRVGIPPVER